MATIFNRILNCLRGVNRSGAGIFTGSFKIGTSGAVASSDCPGFTVTKQTAAGQYRIQLINTDNASASPNQPTSGGTATTPWGFQAIHAMVVSAVASGTPLTTDSALKCAVRNFTPLSGYFDLQFYKDVTSTTSETHVDTDIESGGIVLLDFIAKLSTVTP